MSGQQAAQVGSAFYSRTGWPADGAEVDNPDAWLLGAAADAQDLARTASQFTAAQQLSGNTDVSTVE